MRIKCFFGRHSPDDWITNWEIVPDGGVFLIETSCWDCGKVLSRPKLSYYKKKKGGYNEKHTV